MIRTRYVLGVDLGPPATFTAAAVVERADDPDPEAEPSYALRHLDRFPPGTAYSGVADAMGKLLRTEPLEGSPVVVDVTVVGTGVLGLFRTADPTPEVIPVVVTAGHHAEYSPGGAWMVPKKDLVTGLQLLLQARRLTIPRALPDADLLARELGNFRVRTAPAADPSQADWREGRDDDLVLAVALACWQAGRLPREEEWDFDVMPRRRGRLSGGVYVPGERGQWEW